MNDNMLDALFNDFDSSAPVGEYGVRFLDDKLEGINKGEVILIGADSGIGKSTLASQIAKKNTANGVKTALFSIENQSGDYKRKEIWRKYKVKTKDWTLTFRRFNRMVYLRVVDSDIYQECKKEVEKEMEGLYLVEFTENLFTLTELQIGIKDAVKKYGCQLVIFDHIDYLDEDEQELVYDKETGGNKVISKKQDSKTFLKKTMKTLRDIQRGYDDVPIIVFSQLRKNNDSKMIIPSLDEFYGSGDKVKIATTVIVLAPDYEKNKDVFNTTERYTFICIRKDRFDGKGLARCVFDLKKQEYTNSYIEGYTDKWGYVAKFEGE